jgi:hypothetical protein
LECWFPSYPIRLQRIVAVVGLYLWFLCGIRMTFGCHFLVRSCCGFW